MGFSRSLQLFLPRGHQCALFSTCKRLLYPWRPPTNLTYAFLNSSTTCIIQSKTTQVSYVSTIPRPREDDEDRVRALLEDEMGPFPQDGFPSLYRAILNTSNKILRERIRDLRSTLDLTRQELRHIIIYCSNCELLISKRSSNQQIAEVVSYLAELFGGETAAKLAILNDPWLLVLPLSKIASTVAYLKEEVFDGDMTSLRSELILYPAILQLPIDGVKRRIQIMQENGKDVAFAFSSYMRLPDHEFEDWVQIPCDLLPLFDSKEGSEQNIELHEKETLLGRIKFVEDVVFDGDKDAAGACILEWPTLLSKSTKTLETTMRQLHVAFGGDPKIFQSVVSAFPQLLMERQLRKRMVSACKAGHDISVEIMPSIVDKFKHSILMSEYKSREDKILPSQVADRPGTNPKKHSKVSRSRAVQNSRAYVADEEFLAYFFETAGVFDKSTARIIKHHDVLLKTGRSEIQERLQLIKKEFGENATSISRSDPSILSNPNLEFTIRYLHTKVFGMDRALMQKSILEYPEVLNGHSNLIGNVKANVNTMLQTNKDPSSHFHYWVRLKPGEFEDWLKVPSNLWFDSTDAKIAARLHFLERRVFGGDAEATRSFVCLFPVILAKSEHDLKDCVNRLTRVLFDNVPAKLRSELERSPKLLMNFVISSRFQKRIVSAARKGKAKNVLQNIDFIQRSHSFLFREWLRQVRSSKSPPDTTRFDVEESMIPSTRETSPSLIHRTVGMIQNLFSPSALNDECSPLCQKLANKLGITGTQAQIILNRAPETCTTSESELERRLELLKNTLQLSNVGELSDLVTRYPKILYIDAKR